MSHSDDTVAIEIAAKAVDNLLTAIDGTASEPVAKAYRSALRPKGEDIAQALGEDALSTIGQRAAFTRPDRQLKRRMILMDIWRGLPGYGAEI